MSTIPLHNDHTTHRSFDAIDQHVNRLELETTGVQSSTQSRTERLINVYAGVRPILAALSVVALIPGRWREALRVFVTLMDEITVTEPTAHTLPIAPSAGKE
jgi:hypothetical protein